MVSLGDPQYCSQQPGSIPFKWEIEPGVPKQPPPPSSHNLQLRPPPAGISYTLPGFPFRPLFASAAPTSERRRSRQRTLRQYSKRLTITSNDKLPPTGSFVRRMPSPSPPRFAVFATTPPSSPSSSIGSGSPERSERMPGCFPVPSLLKRKGVKSIRTSKSTTSTCSGSDFASPRSFGSFRESPRLTAKTVSFSSFRKSPVSVEDLEWATYGLF